MKAFYSDVFVLPLPESHRFPMAKYGRLRERLLSEGIMAASDLHVPEAIPWDDLSLVHDPSYVNAVATGTLPAESQRRIGFPWSPEMVERSRRSVGATLAAAREALNGVGWASANLAGGTHHAFSDRGEGYCVLNDIAVAARVMLRDGAIVRAAVVDCDVHQGNGTASIFGGETAVFTFSMHGARNFPFRKERSDLDVEFEDGAGDDEYLGALARHLPEVLDGQRPDLVFYLAGADPYEGDRLGRLRLTVDGLRTRDRLVFEACRERGIAVAVTMGGGYAPDVEAIVTIHLNTVKEAVRHAAAGAARTTIVEENRNAAHRTGKESAALQP
jgi:acetoin utilization deacetylase AcuC-like enzyme